jgi:hypothetical protein
MAYKQHFIEWFSGKQLPSYWTQVGAGSNSMVNEADGGVEVVASSAEGFISFNNIKPFSSTASVLIGVSQRVTSNGHRIGFLSSNTIDNLNDAYMQDWSTNTYKLLRTGDGSASSDMNTTVAVDTSFHTYKLEMTSSAIKLNVGGTLEADKTSNRPVSSANLQPFTGGYSNTSRTRYMECYNT